MDKILNSIMLFSLISTPIDKFQSKAYKLYANNTKIQRKFRNDYEFGDDR